MRKKPFPRLRGSRQTEQAGHDVGVIEVKEELCGSILRITDLLCRHLKQALRSPEHDILIVVLAALFLFAHSHTK